MSLRSTEKFPKDSDASRLDATFSEFMDQTHPTVTGISNLAVTQDISGDTKENTKIDDTGEQESSYISAKAMDEESTGLLDSSGRRGWRNLSSLERALSIALGLVSALAVALMIAVIVVGVKLNEDDYKAVPKVTTTLLPPWVTTVSTTSKPEVTTRERPTSTAPTVPSSSWGTCLTNECFRVAGEVVLSLDETISPCDDFYKFACGGWMTNNPTTEEGLVITHLSKAREKFFVDIKSILESDAPGRSDDVLTTAKEVYSTCMFPGGDTSSHAAELNSFLEDQLVNLSENATDVHPLYQLLGSLRRDLGANYILSMRIDSDINARSKNAIYLDKPETGINLLSFGTAELSAYKDLIVEMWITIYPQNQLDYAEKTADEIIEFELQLLQISLNGSTSSSVEMNDVEFWELDPSSNGVETDPESWRVFLSEVFRQTVSACNATGDCEISTVILNDPEFLQDIESLLNNSDYATIGNYLRWRIIQDFARDADEKFYNPLKQFEEKILGYPNPTIFSTRWKYCASRALYFFPSVISHEYVEKYITDFESFHEDVNAIADSVLLSFYGMAENFPWIAINETRNVITNDLDDLMIMMSEIGSIFNDTNSANDYSGLNLTDSLSSLQNIFDLTKWLGSMELPTAFGNQDMNRMTQNMDAQRTLSVLFSSLSDTIYFPVGILQPPTFRGIGSNLISLNYGSLGTLIGRSLIEVLHSSAVKHVNGSLTSTWDEESSLNYQNATECLTPMFSDSYEQVTEGEQTPSQVIAAHLGGLTSAFKAYKLDTRVALPNQLLPGLSYTPEQIFFLGYAQTMCRSYPHGKTPTQNEEFLGISSTVRESLENYNEFQAAWNCPKSKNVCSLW